jgi:hypothetical protein
MRFSSAIPSGPAPPGVYSSFFFVAPKQLRSDTALTLAIFWWNWASGEWLVDRKT